MVNHVQSLERLNQFLARRGVASRRGADRLIAQNRVTVNGVVVALGYVIEEDQDQVQVDGKDVGQRPALRNLLFNKPKGLVCTHHDQQGRSTVFDAIPEAIGLVLVGRLDAPSRGLLLFTNDGELAMRLTHPRFGVIKHYRVKCAEGLTLEKLQALRAGVVLDDGLARPLGVNVVEKKRHTAMLEIAMGEGRKREVRRMFAAVGLTVLDLQRIGLGPLHLGRLAEGSSRPLRNVELNALYKAVGLNQDRVVAAKP